MRKRLSLRQCASVGVTAAAMAASIVFVWMLAQASAADAVQSVNSGRQHNENGDTRVVAVLFSVGKTKDARKEFKDVPNLDLLEVNGVPMITRVYNVLRQSKHVQKIVVVAAPETEEKLEIGDCPPTSFLIDKGDAAKNVQFGIGEVSKGDLIMFIPSDLPLVTADGLDRLIERVLEEKRVDLVFPMVSRVSCERKYPEERRTYASFQEGQFTGAHVEFVRPDLFLEHVDKVKASKDNLYNVYHMRRNAIGMVRFLGLRLTLRYIFGSLSTHEVEQHIFDTYHVTAKAIEWNDPDLATDLSEPDDIRMIQRALEQREAAKSRKAPEISRAGHGQI
ncbi:nucleotidyltransferase family protein [Candidatus Poribacteria bacterium]|nr:nucleotidyltransferase family protein [Candidatus Poribacteria bacterium]